MSYLHCLSSLIVSSLADFLLKISAKTPKQFTTSYNIILQAQKKKIQREQMRGNEGKDAGEREEQCSSTMLYCWEGETGRMT